LNLINSELMSLEVRTSGLLKQFGSDDEISKVASQTFVITVVSGPTAIELVAAGGIGLILLFLIVVGLFKVLMLCVLYYYFIAATTQTLTVIH